MGAGAVFVEGTIVAERYRLDRLLGEGGMGAVWSAKHVVTRKRVAIKALHPAMSKDADIRGRFVREARAASAVNHPNVVQIYDVLEHDGQPIIVMELLRGESLGARLERDGRLAVADLPAIFGPAIDAIQAAHDRGIVHRDLKPDNIFLVDGAAGTEVRVLDFGIAKLTALEGDAAKTGKMTQAGAMLGTPYYMSPEQACGDVTLDERSDIWALGIILYECLAGHRPTEGPTLGAILRAVVSGNISPIAHVVPSCPPGLAATIGAMLTVERKARSITLDTVKASLLQPHAFLIQPPSIAPTPLAVALAETHSPSAPAPTPAPSAQAMSIHIPVRSSRGLVAAGVGALALVALSATWVSVRGERASLAGDPSRTGDVALRSTRVAPPLPALSSSPGPGVTPTRSSPSARPQPSVTAAPRAVPTGPPAVTGANGLATSVPNFNH